MPAVEGAPHRLTNAKSDDEEGLALVGPDVLSAGLRDADCADAGSYKHARLPLDLKYPRTDAVARAHSIRHRDSNALAHVPSLAPLAVSDPNC